MNAHESPSVAQVFELLNRWRHLPNYSLEPQLAPFFAIFLRDVLRKKFCSEIHETVIPEFPLQIHTLYNKVERKKNDCRKAKPGHSKKVDYVAFDKDTRTVYLVELKTDMSSRRVKQDKYLKAAREKPFSTLLKGVRRLAKLSDSKRKYVHLLHQLHSAGFVSNACALEQLYKKSFSKKEHPVSGWTNVIKRFVFEKREPKLKVVFIQPEKDPMGSKNDGFEFIYFEEVAETLQQRGDLGYMFANYLRQWTEKAGDLDPRSFDRS